MSFKPGSILKSAYKSKTSANDNDEDDIMKKVKQGFKPGSKLKKALPHSRKGAID